MSSRSAAYRTKNQLLPIFNTIETSENLLNLLVIAGDDMSQTFFIATLLKAHPRAFEGLQDNPLIHFRTLLAWFGL